LAGLQRAPPLAGPGRWVAQQGRNLLLVLEERGRQLRSLLPDHDAKFSRAFDDVVRDQDAEILVTPVRAPRANAYAERWIQRSAPSIGREAPDPPAGLTVVGDELQGRGHRLDLLGGLLHEYRRAA
jgi:hypothetical protein